MAILCNSSEVQTDTTQNYGEPFHPITFPFSYQGLIRWKMIIGAALTPIFQGALANKTGVPLLFIVPVFCCSYPIFHGLRGYQVKPIKD